MAISTATMAKNLADTLMQARGLFGNHRVVSAVAAASVVTVKLDTGETFTLTVA